MKCGFICFFIWFSLPAHSQCGNLPVECEVMEQEFCDSKSVGLIETLTSEFSAGISPTDIDVLYLAALTGDENSQFVLGSDLNSVSSNDYSRNICWLMLAKGSGITEADHFIGKIYSDSKSNLYDFDKAVRHYETSTKSYNEFYSDSYFDLGLLYQSNSYSDVNESIIINNYEMASDLGHPEASYNLGVKYNKKSDSHSIKKAIEYYERSINSNREDLKGSVLPSAYYNLGLIYLTEDDYADPQLALNYFKTSLELGIDDAAYYLGHIYALGVGVKLDKELAKKYFSTLADKGDGASINAMSEYGYYSN